MYNIKSTITLLLFLTLSFAYSQEFIKTKNDSSINSNLPQDLINVLEPSDYFFIPANVGISENNPIKSDADTLPMIFNEVHDVFYNMADWSQLSASWNDYILYLGNGADANTNWRGYTLSCYDKKGEMIWKKTYADSSIQMMQANDIYIHTNGDIFIGGITYRNSTTKYDRFISKIDANGDIVLFREFSDETSNYLQDIKQYSGDTLMILSGVRTQSQSIYNRTQISLISLDGDILHTYIGDSDLAYPYELTKYQGKLIVGGHVRTDPGESFNYRIFFKIYDMDLNLLDYNQPNITTNEYYKNLTIVGDNLLLTSVITYRPPPGNQHKWRTNLAYLNSNYDPVGRKYIGPYSIHANIGGPSVLLNEEYIVTPIILGESYLYIHDLEKNEICHFLVEMPDNQMFIYNINGIAAIPPGHIAGTGFTAQNDATQDQWNYLSEDIEYVISDYCNDVAINEIEYSNDHQYYIHLSSDKVLNIKNLKFTAEHAQVYIYDLKGNRLLEEMIADEIQIDVKHFSSGLYLVKIFNHQRMETHKVIIN